MSKNHSSPVALVTGANRGIGLEVCRQLAAEGYAVVLGGRDADLAATAAAKLANEGGAVIGTQLDVTSEPSIRNAIEAIASSYGRLDVLVNNAGVGFDPIDQSISTNLATAASTFEANLFGAWRLTQQALPLLLKSGPGARIVNVSSEAGSFTSTGYFSLASQPGVAAYAVSKAALNALTIKLASSLRDKGVLVNAVCPGWTATYPGAAEQGARPVKDGAASIVWAATLPPDGPTGGFFRDGALLAW